MVKWAFDILGIEVTREKEEIKRAYSELVKNYHPEEHPEEWTKVHAAYEAAMQYAESGEIIQSDGKDNPVDRQTRDERTKDQNEQNKRLEQRMYELMQMKNKNAYAEWNQFFEKEFTEDAAISVMQILLEIVQAYPLRGEIVRLIMNTMSARAQRYRILNDDGKAMLAEQIVRAAQAQIPERTEKPGHTSVR